MMYIFSFFIILSIALLQVGQILGDDTETFDCTKKFFMYADWLDTDRVMNGLEVKIINKRFSIAFGYKLEYICIEEPIPPKPGFIIEVPHIINTEYLNDMIGGLLVEVPCEQSDGFIRRAVKEISGLEAGLITVTDMEDQSVVDANVFLFNQNTTCPYEGKPMPLKCNLRFVYCAQKKACLKPEFWFVNGYEPYYRQEDDIAIDAC